MKRSALLAFLSLGMVSLFADICYEGMRSVIGSYIEFLGLPIIFAGLLGAAEFVGYLTRFVSGLLATITRSTKAYWALIYIGYLTNFAVPALALVSRWDLVVLLIFIERVGKGLRSPVRDVLLAELTEGIGKGKGFGIHELLDQVGAFIGPIFVAWALLSSNNYSYAYSLLAVPVIISLAFLTLAFLSSPHIKSVRSASTKGYVPSRSILYIFTSSLMFLGFIHWSIIAYHFKASNVLLDYQIALAYSIAMVADAVIAVPIGIIYDKIGLKSLLPTPLIILLIAISLSISDALTLVLTAVLWGVSMSIYETIMRAALSDFVEPANRAFAYGVFNTATGVSWMLGSIVVSYLYSVSWYFVVGFVVIVELIAFASLLLIIKFQTIKD
ncbi:MAG: MFS transporter [Sulfolobales archaeon]